MAKTADEQKATADPEQKTDLAADLKASEAQEYELQPDGPNPDEVEITVTLQARHAQYLEAMAAGMSMKRGEQVSVSRALEILIREKYAMDPLKGGLVNPQSSGLRQNYNPMTGGWSG